MGLTVAIVGRPNVGKSTLFNRLTGRSRALVDDTPGVTRDRRMGEGRIGSVAFNIVDTAGYEDAADESLPGRMRLQTERAVGEADVVLLLVDARTGLTPVDRQFAGWLRRQAAPVILVANKCEGRKGDQGLYEMYELGLGDPVAVSAAHGEGLADLAEALIAYETSPPADEDDTERTAWQEWAPAQAPELDAEILEKLIEDDATLPDDGAGQAPIQVAIVGRPNAGKSTLVNALLRDERTLTGPEPGITRDSIYIDWTWRDRRIRLVDTAGMRKRSRVQDKLERMSVADSLYSVRHSQVVVLLLDVDMILDRQDLTIARHVIEEGRALVVAVNKWDTVEEPGEALKRLRDRLDLSLAQARGVATVTISALRRQRLSKLMDTVLETYDVWNQRVSTGKLNRWLAAMLEAHPPPLVEGRRVKLRYITQVKARPPSFALWSSRPEALPEDYARYLINGLRQNFDLPGVPIRLFLRRIRNPYANRK